METSWVYDVSTGQWHERGHWNVDTETYTTFRGQCHTYGFDSHLVGDSRSGKLFEMAITLGDEDGELIRRMRRSVHISPENEWSSHIEVQIMVDADPQRPIFLRWSDDGCNTWSNYREVEAGFPQRFAGGQRAVYRRLGRTRDRVYELVVNDAGATPVTVPDAEGSGGNTVVEEINILTLVRTIQTSIAQGAPLWGVDSRLQGSGPYYPFWWGPRLGWLNLDTGVYYDNVYDPDSNTDGPSGSPSIFNNEVRYTDRWQILVSSDGVTFGDVWNHANDFGVDDPFAPGLTDPYEGIRTTGIVTVTTESAHGLSVGQTCQITGTTDSSFDGTWVVQSVPSTTTFVYNQPGALGEATATGGTES